MDIYKYLGIDIPTAKRHGNPFKVFFSKKEQNDYLLHNGVISQEEHFLRENPEFRARPSLSTNEPF